MYSYTLVFHKTGVLYISLSLCPANNDSALDSSYNYKVSTWFSLALLGCIEPLVVKFADGGPKKRQQTQQNHGMTLKTKTTNCFRRVQEWRLMPGFHIIARITTIITMIITVTSLMEKETSDRFRDQYNLHHAQ